MIYEKIDLYQYFGLERKPDRGGYLTAICRNTLPEVLPKIRPAMLVIPGGGYWVVAQKEGEPTAIKYMEAGYASFVLDYSVRTKFPTPLLEACMAVIYIKENAQKYFVDEEHISAIGFSAGAHLAGMLANLYLEPEIKEILKQRASLAKINALIMSYPVVSMTDFAHVGSRDLLTEKDASLYDRLSVQNLITKDSPPVFIWHTSADACVPVENSLMLASAYRKANVGFALHIFEEGWHGLSLCDDESNNFAETPNYVKHASKWFELSLDWLSEHGFVVKNYQ